MKAPDPGEYSDTYQEQGGRALVYGVCEFCHNGGPHRVATNLVRPVRFVLPLTCQFCNRSYYATPAQGPGTRRAH